MHNHCHPTYCITIFHSVFFLRYYLCIINFFHSDTAFFTAFLNSVRYWTFLKFTDRHLLWYLAPVNIKTWNYTRIDDLCNWHCITFTNILSNFPFSCPRFFLAHFFPFRSGQTTNNNDNDSNIYRHERKIMNKENRRKGTELKTVWTRGKIERENK